VTLAQFGQYPAPRFSIAHISDTHLLGGGALQFGAVDTTPHLRRALELLGDLEQPPQAIIISGDVADRGEPDAYLVAKQLVESAAAALEAPVFWAIGNHDDRRAYSGVIFGAESDAPQDRVHELDGLRIVSLDTSLPGHHHGELEPGQRAWLQGVLATPAEHGTILVMHHPPLPMALDRVSHVIELDGQAALAGVLRGSDVRAILSGHLHYPIYSTFAGIPVFTASATCSTMELAGAGRTYGVRDAGQAIAMLHLFDPGAGGMPEAPVSHTVLPLAQAPLVVAHRFEEFAQLESMTHAQRRILLSRHPDRDHAGSAHAWLDAAAGRDASGTPA
jgi:3',5'-cyclic AMP phosphodiesterase CpdA